MIGRTSFQKLAYFATEAGLPTGLRFERGSYGPFSRELKKVVTRLHNNSLIKEQPRGEMVQVLVGSAFESARGNFQESFAGWQDSIDRLVDLFSRMSTRQAEVAATVHFAAKELTAQRGRVSELDVFEYVDNWKPSKFSRDEVAAAIRNLGLLGWLTVRASRRLPVPAVAGSAAV